MTKEEVRRKADEYNESLSKHPSSMQELTEALVGFYEHLRLPYTDGYIAQPAGNIQAAIPCGGCGEDNPKNRCIGCMHDFYHA